MWLIHVIISVYIISRSVLVAGQIVFPGQEEEAAIRRRLDLAPETRNVFSTQNIFGPCNLESGAFGECLPYSQCPELKNLVGRNGLSSPMINFLRARLCAVSASNFRLCCATERQRFIQPTAPPITVPPVSTRPFVRPVNPSRRENLIPTENECGFATTNRITQGEKFPPGSQPWLVGLGTVSTSGQFQLQCGGALITRRHILSAAHCFVPQKGALPITHAIMGEHSLSQDNEREPPVVVRIVRKSSPGYNDRSHVNDLEMLELQTDVEFTGYIRPICLPFGFENDEFIGETMTIIGWGDTFFRSMAGSDIPLKAKVSIIPRQQCNTAYDRSPLINIGREQICASSFQRDACQGDSGGPFIFDGRRSYLVGVVSFGIDCAGGTFPGVYTFVPHYLRWIQDNL